MPPGMARRYRSGGQVEQPPCVVRGGPRHVFNVHSAQRGDVAGDDRQPRRLVALATDTRVGLVRRIGLQQQLLQWHRADKPLQALRTLVGQRSAQAKQESQLVQLCGLFRAAGKAVHHAAQATDATDRGDHRIHCTARMHDHGQIELAGQLQLAEEVLLLSLGIQALDEEIQPTLANRAGPLLFDPFTQLWQVFGPVLVQEHRVQAIGGEEARRLLADLAQLRPAGRSDRRNHLHLHAGSACAVDDRRAVDAVITAIRRIGGLRGVVHSFPGSPEQAAQLDKLSFLLGLGGPLTYDRAQRLQRLVREMPLEQLLLETDAPDQPDAGIRGQRNEPARLSVIARHVAALRGTDVETVARLTSENARRLFALPAA